MSESLRNKVGVIGAGRWGTTLAHIIATGGLDTLVYSENAELVANINAHRVNKAHLPELDLLHERVTATATLEDLTANCDLLLIAVSVHRMRAIVRRLGDTLDGSHSIVHAVRGLEAETFATPSRIVAEETCVRKIGALLGPALVDELLAERPNAAVIASRFPSVIALARKALVNPVMRVYSNPDLVGVEAAAAASNVMALALGVVAGLSLGPATYAVLVTRSVAEMSRLCAALGGQATTAFGLAGLGDLLVLREGGGQEVEIGKRLAAGETAASIIEELGPIDAFDAVKTFNELSIRRGVDAEITRAVHDLAMGIVQPLEAVRRLMTVTQMKE